MIHFALPSAFGALVGGLVAAALWSATAHAEPYLAVQQGYKCVACHVNASGGGLRNDFGIVFAENVMPAYTLPAGFPVWSGRVFDFLRLGGDLRASRIENEVQRLPTQRSSRWIDGLYGG